MADAIPFSLTPAGAIDGIIDMRTTEGRKLFYGATKAEETLFDCEPKDLLRLLDSVQTRAKIYGWNANPQGILWIPETIAVEAEANNLIDSGAYLPATSTVVCDVRFA